MENESNINKTEPQKKFKKIRALLTRIITWKNSNPSIFYCIFGLICILSLFAIEYIGGLICFPLIVLPLGWPAQTVPCFLWLFSVIMLIIVIIRTLKNIRKIYIPIGALVIAIGSMYLYFHIHQPNSFFVRGLKTRFSMQFGYPKMREFAKEVSQNPEGIVRGDEDPRFSKDRSKRYALAKKYSFISWWFYAGQVFINDNTVKMLWGSALPGHWGFEVSLNGPVENIKKGASLKVTDDIQFVYYE